MSAELDSSHRWGERSYQGDMIPVCLDCRVDGFENEPAAFDPCPGEPPKTGKECGATMESTQLPGHTHRCGNEHKTGDHHCRECSRWFGKR